MKSFLNSVKAHTTILCMLMLAGIHLMATLPANGSEPTEILVVTGGHGYDKPAFEKMFTDNDRLQVDMIAHPEANKALAEGKYEKYKAVVFYDMWQDITDDQKKAFLELTQQGVGLVFLHHSLASYQDWAEFQNIRGGLYLLENQVDDPARASGYKHDIELDVKVLKNDHPVTKNMQDFTINDEGYSNISILPSVNPLLKVDHPHCSDIVAWTNKYNHSNIVYILLGHGNKAYTNKHFQKLVFNAIDWVGHQTQKQ